MPLPIPLRIPAHTFARSARPHRARPLAELPEDHRQVITLSRLFGYAHSDIAAEMGRSEGAVRVLLHRALARLAWVMGEGDGGGAGGAG